MASKPAVASKPAFTPTQSGGVSSRFAPSQRAVPQRQENVDRDGWGADAPEVTRTQLEKVAPAYQPTKVNMRELTSKPTPASSIQPTASTNDRPDVVRGAYQPIGKVDIASIRRQAQESGSLRDDRPETVKGSYEPVGQVDIAAIRAKAQGGQAPPQSSFSSPPQPPMQAAQTDDNEDSRPVSERSRAFSGGQSAGAGRLTSMPKPTVSNRFGGGQTFGGTRAPQPGGFEGKPPASAAPVGTASKTYADEGGKTPAQMWAEKKARERGTSGSGDALPSSGYTGALPMQSQTSGGGGWKSGYSGKSWAAVNTNKTGGSLGQQRTGEGEPLPVEEEEQEELQSPSGGIGSLRDRFSGAPPMGAPAAASSRAPPSAPEPDTSNKPNRGIPIPGMPPRPAADEITAPALPTPPPQPRSPTPPTPEREESPIRVAQPIGRGHVTNASAEQTAPVPIMPLRSLNQNMPQDEDDEPERGADIGRSAAQGTASAAFGAAAVETAQPGAETSGKSAIAEYDYEKAEDNELELKEGERVTDIEMVDEDWWMGQNERGETGLFPSNYVKLVEEEEAAPPAMAPRPQAARAAPAPAAATHHTPANAGPTATALYDYEAAEDNEISFPDGAKITNLVRAI